VVVPISALWIAVAVVVPLVAGLLAAWPLWRRRVRDEMGAIVGAGVILLCVVSLVAREYGEVAAVTARCIEAEIGCRFTPKPFTRYAIYGGIGMAQVFVLFVAGLSIEERLRRRDQSRGFTRS
jgi:hypothetical protein